MDYWGLRYCIAPSFHQSIDPILQQSIDPLFLLFFYHDKVVILDHRIGQQFFAGIFGELLRLLAAHAVEKKFDQFSGADFPNAGKTQHLQGVVNGFALRVENAAFEGDVNFGFQRAPFLQTGSLRYGYCSLIETSGNGSSSSGRR